MSTRETTTEKKLRQVRAEVASLERAVAEERAEPSMVASNGWLIEAEKELAELRAKVETLAADVAKNAKRNAASRARNGFMSSFGLVRTCSGSWE